MKKGNFKDEKQFKQEIKIPIIVVKADSDEIVKKVEYLGKYYDVQNSEYSLDPRISTKHYITAPEY